MRERGEERVQRATLRLFGGVHWAVRPIKREENGRGCAHKPTHPTTRGAWLTFTLATATTAAIATTTYPTDHVTEARTCSPLSAELPGSLSITLEAVLKNTGTIIQQE